MSEISDWLTKEMVDRGLTLKDVADQVGVTDGTIVNWRRGRNPVPYEKTELLARAFSVDVELIRRLAGHVAAPVEDAEAIELMNIMIMLPKADRDAILLLARRARDSQQRRTRRAQPAAQGQAPRLRLSIPLEQT